MKIGIYKSRKCKNQLIKRPKDNKLDVDLKENCSWCNVIHDFYLSEVAEE